MNLIFMTVMQVLAQKTGKLKKNAFAVDDFV
jgi:hypothetical protein